MPNTESMRGDVRSPEDVLRARDLWVQLADRAFGEDPEDAFVELVDTMIAGYLSLSEIEVLVAFGHLLSSHSSDVVCTLASLAELVDPRPAKGNIPTLAEMRSLLSSEPGEGGASHG
ncbi:MAG: hypothetical protein ACYDCF_10880 [Burkholderiales bacterium]